jgi:hypothetical protein
MLINAKLKRRLERLEQVIKVERVPFAFQVLRLALPQLSDEDLEIQVQIFRRGAPLLAQTEEEAASLERLGVEMEAAARRMAEGTASASAFD